jgi:ABC-type phosphate/phosphonate transport system substrate-binding protein
VQDFSIGRIEEMKILGRNLLLASSALALVMLFGCSSSEESSSSDTSSQSDSSSNCQFDNPEAQAECERAEEMMN